MSSQHLLALWLTFLVGLGYVILVWWLDRYEKEPLWLLGLTFGWGLLMASAFSYLGELVFTWLFPVPNFVLVTAVAPIYEETLKALGPLAVFLAFKRQIDDPLDGLVYGAASGLGFGLAENILYIFGTSEPLSLFFVRSILFGAMHGLFTGLFGLGVGFAATRERGRALLLSVGFAGSVLAHSLHNTLAQLGQVGLGLRFYIVLAAALLAFAARSAAREKDTIERFLRPEVQAGRITQEELTLALSGKLGLLANEFSKRRKLKSLLTKLALSLRKLHDTGSPEALAEVERLRKEIESVREARG